MVHTLNMGGTEKLVMEMSRAFSEEFDMAVICLDEPGSWASTLRSSGVPVHCVWRQTGFDMAVAHRLASRLRVTRPHIVHAHQYTPWFYSALSRLFYRSPRLLFEEHGRFYPERDKFVRRQANRLLLRPLTDRIVAVSEDVRSRLVRYEGLERNDIDVVYNGTHPPRRLTREERQALRGELAFSPHDFVVGTVGRFDPIKNLPLLVRSIAEAREAAADVRGLLVGDGPELSQVRSMVDDTGMKADIRLTGFREDASDLTQCMDLFVLSSLSEGTSMALLDAMAAGVPVAVTNVGGNTEVVREDKEGWVVPSNSIRDMTAAIRDARDAPEKRSRFADAAQARFAELFTFDAMLTRYRHLYRELASGLRSPSPGDRCDA